VIALDQIFKTSKFQVDEAKVKAFLDAPLASICDVLSSGSRKRRVSIEGFVTDVSVKILLMLYIDTICNRYKMLRCEYCHQFLVSSQMCAQHSELAV
jgi:hypothetical protein